MTLPVKPKKEPRPVPISFRLSKKAVDSLRAMAKSNNLSQADVLEHLIQQEYKQFEKKPSK